MAFRFVHTADVHLDSPLKSLAMRDEALADVVANATRQAFVRVVDLCINEQVNALLIAGDLYDGNQTSMKTARFLASQLRRLDEKHINVFIIRGNHDAESKITRQLTLPDCVHVFGSKGDSVVLKSNDPNSSPLERPVVVHGASFSKPHAPDSLLPLYKSPDPSAINIGMMHTSLDGAVGHDLYAPCSLADLQSHGYDYWALGHIHKRAIHVDAGCTVVMPGIPQGRDIGESGEKSVTLVTVNDDGRVDAQEHLLALAQFEEIAVSFEGLEDWSKGVNSVMGEIDQVADACDAEHLVARVVITGATTLAWKLRRDEDLFKQELVSRLEDDGQRWLDKLIIKCEPPAKNDNDSTIDTTPYEELHALMIDEIKHTEAYRKKAKQSVEVLLGLLPVELRTKFGEDEASLEKNIELLALEGSTQISANLQPADNTENTASLVDKRVPS